MVKVVERQGEGLYLYAEQEVLQSVDGEVVPHVDAPGDGPGGGGVLVEEPRGVGAGTTTGQAL